MRSFALLAAATGLVAANTVTFLNQDDTTREVIFTPNSGCEEVEGVTIQGNGESTVTLPQKWQGNWIARPEGCTNEEGMLGEVTFQGSGNTNFFDVSAIVNSTDYNNVQQLYPKSQHGVSPMTLFSGCSPFPCDTLYKLWDDVETKATDETDFICTLGSGTSSASSSGSPSDDSGSSYDTPDSSSQEIDQPSQGTSSGTEHTYSSSISTVSQEASAPSAYQVEAYTFTVTASTSAYTTSTVYGFAPTATHAHRHGHNRFRI